MPSEELSGQGKRPIQSVTIQGNILAIIASVGTIVAALHSAAEIPVVVAASGAIWGNVMSIFGRMRATERIEPVGKS